MRQADDGPGAAPRSEGGRQWQFAPSSRSARSIATKVEAIRIGREGGEIRLGAVVRLLEEGQSLVECLTEDGGACTLDGRCRLKSRLRSAEAAFLADLDRSTLAEIALDPTPAG